MKIKANKTIATGMAMAMSLSMAVPAIAADLTVDTAGGTGSAEAVLTAEGATFDVTVPMQLPINVDAKGVVKTATDAKIVNGSSGAVAVTNVTFTPKKAEGWAAVQYGKDMSAVKVGTKEIGFKINECVTGENGDLGYLSASFPAIAAMNDSDTDELALTYDATVPAQKTAITNITVADVVFTIGWDEVAPIA